MLEQFGNAMEMIKKLQQNVADMEDQLKHEQVEVSSGDAVRVIMNGQQEVIDIEINAKYLSADNSLLLQNLIVNTVNSAYTKSREMRQKAMDQLAGAMNLPKIPGLF
ncbi:YbaB/EbfC family nucleoid-associated protein [Acetonema longum]|uniref:Nucleoid-associated protein ALO_18190 n=1 Tax=Acetonema longum DSM 6540 TaxID=1009370 RepID=F7NNE7_9FIRM|nr:YbaB/EbfC family nucleoid-associated protein [Acetonema longum]EGO62388.1 hypothetical protein ALO_18190 [Acetonema longum DSM 6540]